MSSRTESAIVSMSPTPTILIPYVPHVPPGASRITQLIRELADHAVDAVEGAGAHVVALEEGATADIPGAFERCDGVLILGGGDVDPATYGADTRHPSLYGINSDRDAAEIAAAQLAIHNGVPLLGICRGMHVLNVALNGTLIQHLEPSTLAHRGPEGAEMVTHEVSVDPDSDVFDVLGASRIEVRSGHHQAVDRIGDGLHAAARAADGVVEAVQHRSGAAIGVQWHPEDEQAEGADRKKIFSWLVREAGERQHVRS